MKKSNSFTNKITNITLKTNDITYKMALHPALRLAHGVGMRDAVKGNFDNPFEPEGLGQKRWEDGYEYATRVIAAIEAGEIIVGSDGYLHTVGTPEIATLRESGIEACSFAPVPSDVAVTKKNGKLHDTDAAYTARVEHFKNMELNTLQRITTKIWKLTDVDLDDKHAMAVAITEIEFNGTTKIDITELTEGITDTTVPEIEEIEADPDTNRAEFLSAMGTKELRKVAMMAGVRNASKMKKTDIVNHIIDVEKVV